MNSHHLLCALSSGASVQQESTDHLEAVSLTKEEPIMASRPISRWCISNILWFTCLNEVLSSCQITSASECKIKDRASGEHPYVNSGLLSQLQVKKCSTATTNFSFQLKEALSCPLYESIKLMTNANHKWGWHASECFKGS